MGRARRLLHRGCCQRPSGAKKCQLLALERIQKGSLTHLQRDGRGKPVPTESEVILNGRCMARPTSVASCSANIALDCHLSPAPPPLW